MCHHERGYGGIRGHGVGATVLALRSRQRGGLSRPVSGTPAWPTPKAAPRNRARPPSLPLPSTIATATAAAATATPVSQQTLRLLLLLLLPLPLLLLLLLQGAPMTLAQHLGLIPRPPPLLTDDQWTEVHLRSRLRQVGGWVNSEPIP